MVGEVWREEGGLAGWEGCKPLVVNQYAIQFLDVPNLLTEGARWRDPGVFHLDRINFSSGSA